jgi:hypothetical protein
VHVAPGWDDLPLSYLHRIGCRAAFPLDRDADWRCAGRCVGRFSYRANEKTAHHEHIVFGALMDIDADLQDGFEVTARGVVPGRRVEVR